MHRSFIKFADLIFVSKQESEVVFEYEKVHITDIDISDHEYEELRTHCCMLEKVTMHGVFFEEGDVVACRGYKCQKFGGLMFW